jgi:hypothetical protein
VTKPQDTGACTGDNKKKDQMHTLCVFASEVAKLIGRHPWQTTEQTKLMIWNRYNPTQLRRLLSSIPQATVTEVVLQRDRVEDVCPTIALEQAALSVTQDTLGALLPANVQATRVAIARAASEEVLLSLAQVVPADVVDLVRHACPSEVLRQTLDHTESVREAVHIALTRTRETVHQLATPTLVEVTASATEATADTIKRVAIAHCTQQTGASDGITHAIVSAVNCAVGIQHEDSSLDRFETLQNRRVSRRNDQTYTVSLDLGEGFRHATICGKVDGIDVEDGCLIEHKQRSKRLVNRLLVLCVYAFDWITSMLAIRDVSTAAYVSRNYL